MKALSLLRVGFDLDGVISQTEESTFSALKAEGLIPLSASLTDLASFKWEDNFPNLKTETMMALFADGEVFRQAPVNHVAAFTANWLVSRGIEVHIVTHRPWEVARVDASRWLHNNRVSHTHLTLVSSREEKSAYCQQHGLDVFIEDNLDTAIRLTQFVRRSFLFDRPYNRATGPAAVHVNTRNLTRFYRFEEVLTFFGYDFDNPD